MLWSLSNLYADSSVLYQNIIRKKKAIYVFNSYVWVALEETLVTVTFNDKIVCFQLCVTVLYIVSMDTLELSAYSNLNSGSH